MTSIFIAVFAFWFAADAPRDSIVLDHDGQRGVVAFDHAAHVKAERCISCHHTRDAKGVIQLANCEACHGPEGDSRNPKSAAFNEENRKTAYHELCIGCHQRLAKTVVRSGPVACADCHERVKQSSPHAGGFFLNVDESEQFGESALYSHLHPKHIALDCGDCHRLKPNEADIHEMPGHATCSACHNFAQEAIRRTESFCGECHTSTDATKEHPALFTFPRQHATQEFGDQFSHEAHRKAGAATRCDAPGVAVLSKCADCHAPIQPPAPAHQPEKQMEASHTFCYACHCENPRGYTVATKNINPSRNDCAVCHVAREAKLVPFGNVKDFRHADHVFDTRPRKKGAGPPSHDPDVLCIECHKSAAESHHLAEIREPASAVCLTCHTGRPGLPDILPERSR